MHVEVNICQSGCLLYLSRFSVYLTRYLKKRKSLFLLHLRSAMRKIGNSVEVRVQASSSLESEQRNIVETALDYSGSDWAGSLKAAWQGTWVLNSAFSQVVTPKLQMGGELTYIVRREGRKK